MRYERYTIKQGDTLQLIAQNEANDMSFWTTIRDYNKLVYPYIDSTPRTHVMTYGDTLLIPQETDLSSLDMTALNINELDDITSYALGRDFSLLGESDNFLSRGTTDETVSLSAKNGKLNVVSGYTNLKQALLMRLNTPLGSLPLHPEYGCDLASIIGKKNTEPTVNKLQVLVEQTLRKEGRVSDVKLTLTAVSADTVTMNIAVTPIGMEEQLTMLVGMDNVGSFTIE